ncbi:MAG: hypothetical protein NVS3B5_02180 [Sphingomicrobium sp.]
MNMLFPTPAAEILLRDYQADVVEKLRAGIRAGCRRQVLVAPTAAGKTEMAMKVIQEAQRKGSRTWFIVDRVSLIDQTSERFSHHGIGHGVIQADHWLTDYAKSVQIASAQTLARRKVEADLLPDLIVVDECHCQYRSTIELIQRCPNARVIGLTATPFTKGMAENWDGLVNSITVNQLLAKGFLTPLKIKACVAPDMKGAKKKFNGEYAEEDAGSRGITIIGNVVNTWVDQTQKHFGGPVKTIVFSPSVRHGAELCKQFISDGFNFQQISYLDGDDDDRRAKIAEFRKPNSAIDGLISCAVLTKGFDVADIKCIAEGSQVLTDKGIVPIENVTLAHKLWDGVEFVSHKGTIFKGEQDVIEYAGLTATPDHEVHTAQGWRPLGDCAAEQIPITQTGFGERCIRWDAGYFAGDYLAEKDAMGFCARSLRVHELWSSICKSVDLPAIRATKAWVSNLLSESHCEDARRNTAMAFAKGEWHEIALRSAIGLGISGLRRARHRVSLYVCAVLRAMDYQKPWFAYAGQKHAAGSDRQQRPLRAWQSSLGHEIVELQQYPARWACREYAPFQVRASRNLLCGQDAEKPFFYGADRGADCRSVLSPFRQTKRRVWDILDAGPRNRFTCEGLLVHNCGISCRPYRKSFSSHIQEMGRVMRLAPGKQFGLWLDHSGNSIAFANDTAWLFEHGVDSLSSAELKDREVREPDEKIKKKHFCAGCGLQLIPGATACHGCGWQRPERGEIQVVQGELIDVNLAASGEFKPRQGLRAECLRDPRAIWNAALSYTSSTSSKGPEHARKWAAGIWKGIFEQWPPRSFDGVKANHEAVTPDQYSLIEREVRRFRKQCKRAA